MNREHYGKKCKCSHHESEHDRKMSEMEHPALLQAKTMYGILPQMESKIKYKNCKACTCDGFAPEKKGWNIWK